VLSFNILIKKEFMDEITRILRRVDTVLSLSVKFTPIALLGCEGRDLYGVMTSRSIPTRSARE